ncbi:MurR/RpiR family transcriptional regulator [Companilactobacillus halodurans]|uniref:MurR/RpiR family transcriptional regulator n=1 Tax=Companilactobacillus halodurans TaxID=2584183 RepID=A0A5P0ZM59_9LACO|nr:MurR/RpiR family transcriptional regulator [Companilactobacillus halodurans]MQS75262.1 MurR/RpiR family transcriptional regulator [Companilactobacillus halodurans]MQS97611.1 MurR/RpiR family transcriptional regulator [Companilactobacillus halodurans]
MNIIESIEARHLKLSKSEQKVSSYIMQYPENIERFTITKLATEAHTSTSAVLRFCQTLGFQGYKDFRFEMVNFLRSGRQNRDANTVVGDYVNDYVNVMGQISQIDEKKINNLIDCLLNDQTNYFIGNYQSSLPAKELYYGLSDFGKASIYSNGYITSAHITRSMKEEDTLVLFSISGNKQNFSNFLPDIVMNMPKNSFLITLNQKAELADIFNNTIFLPGSSFSNRSVVDSQSIPMFFVELLLNLMHEEN